MVSVTAGAVQPAAQRRKAIIAGVIGNVLEWYDFGVYGYLVPVISQLFFPAGDRIVSLLLTFAVFGVGFVMRPVGSILFGIYGDRRGRRRALSPRRSRGSGHRGPGGAGARKGSRRRLVTRSRRGMVRQQGRQRRRARRAARAVRAGTRTPRGTPTGMGRGRGLWRRSRSSASTP